MLPTRCQRARRILFWPLLGCALLTTGCLFEPRYGLKLLLGPHQAQLIVISDVRIRNLNVIYDGQAMESPGRRK